jgi:monoamine oxidase
MDNIHFSERVESIEYFNKYVTIKTKKAKYMAKKVICSVPIGVLKAKGVKFVP